MSEAKKELPNKDKRKTFLAIMIIDIVVALLLGLLFFIFLNNRNTNNEPVKIKYDLTSEVIDENSSLDPSRYSFSNISENNEEIVFYSSGVNNSIGTYNPHSYIFSTSDNDLYIIFNVTHKEIKIYEQEIKICDVDGNNVSSLTKEEYTSRKQEDNSFICTIPNTSTTYIYSVSITYQIIKDAIVPTNN